MILVGFQQFHDSRDFSTGTFQGCAQAGDGGDAYLNELKNRDKPGPTVLTANIADLVSTHPAQAMAMGKKQRAHWTPQAMAQVVPAEQKFDTVEGYMLKAQDEDPENCNCDGQIGRDTHTWLGPLPTSTRATASLVAEVSPRMKGAHANWNQAGFQPLISQHVKLRVTGWIMWDQEHGSEVGHSRGTLWEIHPIHAIQYQDAQGQWHPF